MKKVIRKNIRSYNTYRIKEVIENNCNMRVLRSDLLRGKVVIHKMKTGRGKVTEKKDEITEIIQNFYQSYIVSQPHPQTSGKQGNR